MPQAHDGKDIYKELSADMRNSLKHIYRQITTASQEDSAAAKSEALFSEASDQLNEVVKATESAAMDIMDIVEKQLDQTNANAALIASLQGKITDEALDTLRINNEKLATDLTSVLAALGFQDITGQRIKKVMSALLAIENSVLELYLSSGLVMEAAEKTPHKHADEIRAEAKKAVDDYNSSARKTGSELKGPSSDGVSQEAIDNMLAQLGL